MIIFHGGCHECTQQSINPVKFCMSCRYFDFDQKLPDLNNRPLTEAETVRKTLKEKYGKQKEK